VKEGLEPKAVEAIRKGEKPSFERPDEAAVYAFAHELLHNREVSDSTYRKAENEIGNRGLIDLVGILGYYGLICMTIVAFEVTAPKGAPEPFLDT